ncbi:NYN domain-containing protein [Nocardia sp. NPDC020380]|uniref:NYN domain-containing protein n=1 Tax=Nocardia sp. NPDC020380 TaxID=3364309 RepID=UPI00379EE5F2
MTDDAIRLIVVDAANVVGSRPDGWWRDRAGAARRLLGQLAAAELDSVQPTEVTVVLEGAAKAALAGDAAEFDGLRVVPAAGSGDDEIVRVVAAAVAEQSDRMITVVTADRGLRERVEPFGAVTVGPRWLLEQLTP